MAFLDVFSIFNLFLFERKSCKKKQKHIAYKSSPYLILCYFRSMSKMLDGSQGKLCRFIACADSFGIPFDVLLSRLSHGVSKQKDHIMVFLCSDTAKSNEHQKHIFDLRVMRLCDC